MDRMDRVPDLASIILAAGSSSRLGFPKALARFGRRTALEIAVDNSRAVGASPIVVLGHAAEFILPSAADLGATVVVNRRWPEGQLGSLRAALRRLPKRLTGFFLYPVDYPLVRPAHLRALTGAMRRAPLPKSVFLPWHGGHGGHPVLFRGAMRPEFMRLGNVRTARDVVYRDPVRVEKVRIGDGAHRTDFDTPEGYRRLARRF